MEILENFLDVFKSGCWFIGILGIIVKICFFDWLLRLNSFLGLRWNILIHLSNIKEFQEIKLQWDKKIFWNSLLIWYSFYKNLDLDYKKK